VSSFECGLQFRGREGQDRGRIFPLEHRELTVGRARTAGDRAPGWVLLFDPQVQRIHAEMVWNDKEKAFQLVARPNALVEVNGEPVASCILMPGDVVRFGDSVLNLQSSTGLLGSEPIQGPVAEAQDTAKTIKMTRVVRTLILLGGNGAGQQIALTGTKIQLGGNRPEAIPEDRTWWDQDVVLPESEVPHRFMSWHWQPKEKAYEVSLLRPVSVPISFERSCDGVDWMSEMPQGMGASVLLRNQDRVCIGKIGAQLTIEEF